MRVAVGIPYAAMLCLEPVEILPENLVGEGYCEPDSSPITTG